MARAEISHRSQDLFKEKRTQESVGLKKKKAAKRKREAKIRLGESGREGKELGKKTEQRRRGKVSCQTGTRGPPGEKQEEMLSMARLPEKRNRGWVVLG